MRGVWEGVRTITGHKAMTSTEGEGVERANDLNNFFNRFSYSTPPHNPQMQPAPAQQLPSPSQCISTQSAWQHPPPCLQPPPTLFSLSHLSPDISHLSPTPAAAPPPSMAAEHPPSEPPPCITADQVRGELRKLWPQKAAGPDNVCPQVSSRPGQLNLGSQVFNMSLQLGRVPTLWKTSCILPVPKKNRPSELKDFWSVVHTSHLMKTLELDNKLDLTSNTKQLCKKAQSRMYFLRSLQSFNICRKLLIKGRPLQVGEAGQAGRLCGWHEAGPSGDTGREENPQQTAGHHGQCQPPSAHYHQQLEEVAQRQAAPSKELDKQTEKLLCPLCHQTVQLLTRGGGRRTGEQRHRETEG